MTSPEPALLTPQDHRHTARRPVFERPGGRRGELWPISSRDSLGGWSAHRYEVLATTVILVGAALLYGWDLDRQGWGNAYYAAAAQAGNSSWRALLFGAVDPGGAMSTDKPPLSIWLMSLSTWVFGLHGWSVILPQLLMSLTTIAVLYRTVRRCVGPVGGLTAAAVLAVTPVFAVLARFDDPDTLLVLIAVIAAYAALRAGESTSMWWPAMTGALIGAGFLTKWLAVTLVLPGLAAGYLEGLALRPDASRRTRSTVAAAGVCTAAAALVGGWWVALIALTPPASRPTLDGTRTNSVIDLLAGPDGLARVGGSGRPGWLSAAVAEAVSGRPGLLRLVTGPFLPQIGWFLPPAVLAMVLVAVLTATGRSTGTRGTGWWRAGWGMWTAWLAVGSIVLSLMTGAMHPYYSVLLAPAVAALVGTGMAVLVEGIHGEGAACAHPVVLSRRTAEVLAVIAVVLTGGWMTVVAAGIFPGSLWIAAVVAGTGSVVVAVLVLGWPRRPEVCGWRWAATGSVVLCLLTGPGLTCIATTQRAVTGTNPLAGPGPGQTMLPDPPLDAFLQTHQGTRTWGAAAVTATPAAILQLNSRVAILPIGGFIGTLSAPSLDQFVNFVARAQVGYLVLSGPYLGVPVGQTPSGLVGTQAAGIVSWAETVGVPVIVPGTATRIYDLTAWAGHPHPPVAHP